MTRIAIVEDNKVIRESLIEFVQTDPECSCVCTCATAEEALKGLEDQEHGAAWCHTGTACRYDFLGAAI